VSARGIKELLDVDSSERDTAWLQQALQCAVNLEFATLPVYLSGMWSIEEQSGEVYDLINSVVLEEMLHLGLACNMLCAIGGTPQITAPSYPGPLPCGVRPGLEVYLAGLSKDTVAMFMEIEMPEHPVALVADTYPTIGAFYDAILAAFQAAAPPLSAARQMKANFSVTVPDPPDPDKTVTEKLLPLTTLTAVEQAIATIKDQGEGTSTSADAPEFGGELAHYYRFGEIFHGSKLIPVNGTWKWEGDPVEFPACYPVARVPAGGYPDLPAAQKFDQLYDDLITHLQNAWANGSPGDLNTAIGDMFQLYNLAQPIITTPLPGGGGNYGPDFIRPSLAGTPPEPTASVSFKSQILPLFTSTDIAHMKGFGVQLDDYAWMSQPQNAGNVYQQVSSGSMPPSDPWPQSDVQLFKAWIAGGYQP
jgi:hypothetical protein